MKKTILEIKNLKVWFKTETGLAKAVNDISFSLNKGETLAIVGESGCGKSVTALSILRLLKKDTIYHPEDSTPSSIKFCDEDILQMSDKKMELLRGNSISMIFQEPMTSLNPVLSIGTQMVEPLILHQDMDKEEAFIKGTEVLKNMGIPSPEQIMNSYPHQLSGGMKQRVMIGMALACRPEVLIADEPTTALDVTIQAQILNLMRELKSELNMALILITHDLGIVSEMSDQIIVMYGGKIAEKGSSDDIFNNPKHPYTQALLKSRPGSGTINQPLYTIPGIVEPATEDLVGCRFSKRCSQAIDYCKVNEPVKTKLSQTQALFCHIYDKSCAEMTFNSHNISTEDNEAKIENNNSLENNETLLKIKNLKVWFPVYKGWLKRVAGHVRAVDRFSIEVKRGTTLGLVGESGCGKTTLGQSIVRLVNPTDGTILFKGKTVLGISEKELKTHRKNVQIVFQDPFSSLSPSMMIGEIVGEGLHVHNITTDKSEMNALVAKTLEEVGLDAQVINRYPHQFSGGQRQRVSLARALVLNPELLILDESTSALDVSVQAQILNLLKALQQKKGLTYIFISHDLGVIEYLADYVAVMYLGRIVEAGTREEIFENPKHPYTRSLIDAVPKIGKKMSSKPALTGDVPSPMTPPSGCHFHPRCPIFKKHKLDKCDKIYPPERTLAQEHRVSCYWENEYR